MKKNRSCWILNFRLTAQSCTVSNLEVVLYKCKRQTAQRRFPSPKLRKARPTRLQSGSGRLHCMWRMVCQRAHHCRSRECHRGRLQHWCICTPGPSSRSVTNGVAEVLAVDPAWLWKKHRRECGVQTQETHFCEATEHCVQKSKMPSRTSSELVVRAAL